MKKLTVWLVTLLTFAMSVFCFSSCDLLDKLFGNSDGGTYKLKALTVKGVTYYVGDTTPAGYVLTSDSIIFEVQDENNFKLIEKAENEDGESSEVVYTIQLNDDNTYLVAFKTTYDGEIVYEDSLTETWTKENDVITLYETGEIVMKITISDTTVTLSDGGSTLYVFEKE